MNSLIQTETLFWNSYDGAAWNKSHGVSLVLKLMYNTLLYRTCLVKYSFCATQVILSRALSAAY